MRGRAIGVALAAGLLIGASAFTPHGPPDERQRLILAKRDAASAAARAAQLDRAASGERDAAARARAEEQALAARIDQAHAEVDAATARVALVGERLATQRAMLGERQAPVARLLAALQALASRPIIAAVAQPGSVDDLVHVRAVLGGALPVIHARTAALRQDLAATRATQAAAELAAGALSDGRRHLARQRQALARLEAEHSRRSLALGRGALAESDRAIAMGEQARDLVDRIAATDSERATVTELARLGIPPVATDGMVAPRAYGVAVHGSVVTGLGEISPNGVRSRGLTLAVAPGAVVVAPAAGTIVFARRFRDYGASVIVDHGAGWTTLVTGLGTLDVQRGQTIAAGERLGRAGTGEQPQITVELRRRGRPVDMTALM